jgi:hypothetical protein
MSFQMAAELAPGTTSTDEHSAQYVWYVIGLLAVVNVFN